eukprot:scaffold135953_cov21-Tisochrysis_lutea.AAC.2
MVRECPGTVGSFQSRACTAQFSCGCAAQGRSRCELSSRSFEALEVVISRMRMFKSHPAPCFQHGCIEALQLPPAGCLPMSCVSKHQPTIIPASFQTWGH